jgi:hypothetical protein
MPAVSTTKKLLLSAVPMLSAVATLTGTASAVFSFLLLILFYSALVMMDLGPSLLPCSLMTTTSSCLMRSKHIASSQRQKC